ncbi:MAG: ubiquitin-binding protein cue5 [Claussenomyces sp. TS43310]|nr:MAG: ubiquitin-binding protein cue5 [Claussenomyces sp. TS43310]
MSPPRSVKSPTGLGAESPTTVKPLDMDDDDVQESTALGGDAAAPTAEQLPPPKPPRPLSPQQEAENTLKEAFPSIDAAVVKAVLTASGGRVEPAFNALLGMSDPNAVIEPTPPPQPPRPTTHRIGSTPQSQLLADEMYARQLAEHYGGAGQQRGTQGTSAGRQPWERGTGQRPKEIYDENHSFIDDDLPVIKENLRKGFLDTQSTVNKWITNLKKKIDGEEVEGDSSHGSYGPGGPGAQSTARHSGDAKRSGDYNRYDADPQVLSDDFAGIHMHEDGGKSASPAPAPAPRRSSRPLANPDLFKPSPTIPGSSEGRKVSFQSGSQDQDIYNSSPKVSQAAPASKQSKWQPLSTVDPNPVGEVENDPFSLGDSEDEKESKDRVGGIEVKTGDAERLRKAAAESTAIEPARRLEPAEMSGTKDKLAEETLTK